MADTPMTNANERPSLKNLAAALCKAQSEMTGAKKDMTNPHFKSKYADLASVWDAIREPLTKNGLSVVQLLRSIQGGVEVETILMHTSGESISDAFGLPATKADAQGYGSAATYARRYSLMAMVGVAPEDDDGNAAVREAPSMLNAQSRAIESASAEITAQTGEFRSTYEIDKPKKAAAKAKDWTDKAITNLNLMDHTNDSVSAFWNENRKQIEWLAEHAPDQHERLVTACDAARERASAKAA